MGIFQLAPKCRLCGQNAAMAGEQFCALCKVNLKRVRDQVLRKERSDWFRVSGQGFTVEKRMHDQMMTHTCWDRHHFGACDVCGRGMVEAQGRPPRFACELEVVVRNRLQQIERGEVQP